MEGQRDPHSISLKVLRLSRPSLSQQFPLPTTEKYSLFPVDVAEVLDTKDADFDDGFIFSPVLLLPPAFGTVYVGETFSCALCANNELTSDAERRVSNVKIAGEIQAPSGNFQLDLYPQNDSEASFQIAPGHSQQRIVHFDLREEGNHTLAVNISYSETVTAKDQSASSGRFRSFRKLYQFQARPCLNVRTKISPLAYGEGQEIVSLALEAQFDNLADGPVTLRTITFTPKASFKSTSLNWDVESLGDDGTSCPMLSPRDVIQVAFLIEQHEQGPPRELTRDGRIILGQISIEWRTAMGDVGFLSTGWLTTKRR